MNSQYKDKAIPLISVDPQGKYVLTAQAASFLKSIPGPIGVVSVAGLYRTGKSYLLNQMLLNRSSGFGVGPTVNPCTKGLWCWGTPIKGETADGEKLNIIVIDTEGIGALDEDQTHDTRIFTLAILASSCFIYNSVGSIDETAVQNLSLVVNLTKHIQLQTSNQNQEEDPDKIASYFPSFFWVVRDFSLQMIDPEGNKMTSKEYLEKALAPAKGFSDDIEQKNKIRRMLTSFFKQRECFTLIRPLIDETKLQDLDKMNFDDLRPDFVNQVINFRKRVTGRMKPKTLNGQKLNGELYFSMLNSYVGAINEGAVPNIENAWNYMCQQQCTKLMTESLEAFEKGIREIRIPCSAEEINKSLEEAEEVAFEIFKKKSIGDESERFYKELQTKIREKAKSIRVINAEEGKTAFKKYLTQFAVMIQQKMSQYKSFQQFSEDLSKIEERISKEGPNYVDSSLNCQLAMKKLLTQGIIHLSKSMRNEREQIKKTLEERIKMNETQIENLRRDREGQQQSTRQKISQLDKEKIDLAFKLEKIELELERNNKERSSQEEQLSRNLNSKKAQIQQMRKEVQSRISEANLKVQDMSRKIYEEQSNWQKEKAIFELKIKQQSERIEELQKKRQTFDSKLALQTNELSQKYREQTSKLQDQTQQLMRNLTDTRQKYENLTSRHSELTEKYTVLADKYDTVERKLRQETNLKARQIQKLKNENQVQINRIRNELLQNKDENERFQSQNEQKLRKQQSKASEFSKELNSIKTRYQKENQVLTLELEFTRKSLQEARQKMIEMKSVHESKLAAIEQVSGLQRQEQVKKKIQQLKYNHQEQLKTMETDFKQNQKSLYFQIENLTKDRNDLQLKIKVINQQYLNERAEVQEFRDSITLRNQQLENEVKTLQRERNSELISKDMICNQKISQLERELEETRENYHSQKMELEIKVSNEVTQIKNYYEMQREKQEARHFEERDKLKKKYTKMVEDYEKRLQQQKQAYEQQNQRIQSEYGSEINALNTSLRELTLEKDSLAREKVNIEQRYNQISERYVKMENELNEKLQKTVESNKLQKENLTRKLEELQHIKNGMQKELLSLTHERDQYKTQGVKQISQIEQLKSQNLSLSERFETTKKTLQERLKDLHANYMKEKSKFDTDVALLQQKKDFAQQKIVELEEDLKNTREREQEQTRVLKEKHFEDISSLTTKSINDKRSLQEKLEKIRKEAAEMQSTFTRQVSELNKAKAVDEQKIQHLQKKLFETESKRNSQVESLGEQLRTVKDRYATEKSQLKSRIQDLEQTVHRRQSENNELKNNYEIQVALAESKIKNMTQFSESTIAQKVQTIRNLEKQLDDSRRRNENQKSSQQTTHQQIVSRMESKYRNEITQLSQDVTRKTQENQYLTRENERVIKDLNEKLAIEKQSKASLQIKVARVESQFREREAKLVLESEKLRAEKESMGLEIQKKIAFERDNNKLKIDAYERRIAQLDALKQNAFFEKQKIEAKCKMQMNNLQQKIDELKDYYDREKNQNSRLLKDNQKLKAEKKKNNSYINIKNQTTFLPRQISMENKENSQMQ